MTRPTETGRMLQTVREHTFPSVAADQYTECMRSYPTSARFALPLERFIFGFQGPAPARRSPRSMTAVLAHMQNVLNHMPRHETDPGAVDELTAEMGDLAAARARASATMLGDEE